MHHAVILVALSCMTMTTQAAPPALAERFHQRYATLRAVRCTFKDGQGLTGSLEAMRGGRYHVRLSDRSIISDGKTVWNVTPSTKTVIVNALTTTSDDLSLERVFFTLMAVYRVSVASGPDRNGIATLTLTPPAASAVIGGVDQAHVVVDSKLRVTSITVVDGASVTRWTITSMTLDPSLSASRFTYAVPAGWQTVDLRP